MPDKIKDKVLEFAAIAKECPENLQLKCFELLLSDYLNQMSAKIEKKREDKKEEPSPPSSDDSSKGDRGQEDILEKDLHVKVRQFLKKSNLAPSHLSQIFYKEDGDLKPLYDDLKTTKAAESQIRIALLQALKNAIATGDFRFDGEEVRTETQARKCYDAPNFAGTFKYNKALFDNFSAYDKSEPKIALSSAGKEKLAEVIQDLQ